MFIDERKLVNLGDVDISSLPGQRTGVFGI